MIMYVLIVVGVYRRLLGGGPDYVPPPSAPQQGSAKNTNFMLAELPLNRPAQDTPREVALQERVDQEDRDHRYHYHCHLDRLQRRGVFYYVAR